MPFGLCNAPGTFQRCMMAIFHDMIEKTMEVFMDDFSVFRNSFSTCLTNLENMLKRYEDTKLALNWEKSHFMVKEGIVLGHKISKKGIELDKAKIEVISKLPHLTTVKGIRSFLGHAGFYLGCTPYRLVYGKACHIPLELEHKAYWALKHANLDLKTAGDHRKLQLNVLNELRDQAYENSLIYKERIKKLYDDKIKNRIFNDYPPEIEVILCRILSWFPGPSPSFHNCEEQEMIELDRRKLKTHWSGPFTITKVFPYGTVELSQANEPNFKVNGHRIKHYFGGDVPQLDYPDCEVSRALSFCKELHILSFILGIHYPNLID
nr:reverse transcriptase domain-containing protein [Tanacetum cinerariifolium]